MKRVILIGDPVAHSRSPALQNAAFAHLHLDVRYEAWHTPAAELAARIAALRAPDILGANVTLPHKTAVIPLLDKLEPEAARIGAVNTIYKRQGKLIGANTDAPALLEDLRVEGGWHAAGQQVVMLGASGAARAAAYALVDAGVASLVIANRTLERAEDLLADIVESYMGDMQDATEPAPDFPDTQMIALTLDDSDLPSYIASSTLLINATSVGWHTNETALPDPPVSPGALVYDMVYRPTRLLRETAARGARPLDGTGMLLRQGALAFTCWTNQPAPLDVMRTALQER